MKTFESADGLATTMYSAYIQGRNWSEIVSEVESSALIC